MPADGGYSPRMLRAAFFIDDHGESWPQASAELPRVLGTRLRGPALEAYLISQCGFALVRQTSALIECVFDADAVSPVALVGLLYVIGESDSQPIAIRSPTDPIRIDMLTDRRRAIADLSTLIESKRQRPRFERRPCVIEKTAFAQLWRAGREIVMSSIDDVTRHRLLNTLFSGNFTLNEICESVRPYRVTAIGDGIAQFDSRFAEIGIGATYDALSDPNYGKWVSDSFDEYVMVARECTEVVEALVEIPGNTPRRISYTRLILPVSCGSRRLLLAATDVA